MCKPFYLKVFEETLQGTTLLSEEAAYYCQDLWTYFQCSGWSVFVFHLRTFMLFVICEVHIFKQAWYSLHKTQGAVKGRT